MSVSPLGRASRPPGRSSVPQRRMHHFIVITVLLVATVVASFQPKDQCQQDSANFASQIHTIGSIDDALWAITKPDWNVYKLTPCGPGRDSLLHCMKVDSPIAVETKWPKLAESAKSEAKATDFTFPVDNSVVMDSSKFTHKVLAMHSNSFKTTKYFGFDFDTRSSFTTDAFESANMSQGLWISSDEEDKAFRLYDLAVKVVKITFDKQGGKCVIQPNGTQKSICTTGSKDALQIRFQDGDCTDSPMDWSVKKGVLYHKQYYLFESTKVYIFSEQAESDYTKLQTVSLTDFFHCYKPSTMTPLPTSPNVTFLHISTNSTHMSTTVKGSSTTIIIIVVVVIGLVVIVALGLAYFCWCRTKASKDGKSGGNIKLASSSSPNDSKVSANARNVSKGSIKASQTKFGQGSSPMDDIDEVVGGPIYTLPTHYLKSKEFVTPSFKVRKSSPDSAWKNQPLKQPPKQPPKQPSKQSAEQPAKQPSKQPAKQPPKQPSKQPPKQIKPTLI